MSRLTFPSPTRSSSPRKDNSGHYHFTNVWVRRGGKWEVVASHGSRYGKEYRPYADIEKFRREMGKYWDAKEVKRLERYTTKHQQRECDARLEKEPIGIG